MSYLKLTVPAIIVAVATAFAAVSADAADRRVGRTGSRVGSDATGRTVIRFSEPGETRRVLKLLERGEAEAAVAYAEDYLASLDSAMLVGRGAAVPERYFALNALCAALTHVGRADEAVARCTEAIELSSSRWTAVNNRGTAHFVQRNYLLALEDYERALALTRSAAERATIEHNIALAESRLEAGGGNR